MVTDADVPVVESGGKQDFYGSDPTALYRTTKVDRILHDGDEVRLGNAVLVAHLTPGHTKGCTTWTMKVEDGGKSYNVVIVGSPNANEGFNLVNNNRKYPGITQDYARISRTLKYPATSSSERTERASPCKPNRPAWAQASPTHSSTRKVIRETENPPSGRNSQSSPKQNPDR
jgi:hypothetical protein